MPSSSKRPKFNTLTTAGRIAKAAHERERAAAARPTPTSPPPESMPPKKKSRKIPVLAPPAELEAEALRRAEAKKRPKPKPKKTLMTTKDKIAASKKKKAFVPVEHDENGFKAGRGGEAKIKREKSRNLMDIMRDLSQMGSVAPVSASSTLASKVQMVASSGLKGRAKGKARERESVLDRPTERTRRMQQQSRQRVGETWAAQAASSVNTKCEDDEGSSSNPKADLMNFPLELRQQIWRLAVVETQFFVYPAINQEQPDLAMTSRQIRNEVLPLYYGENIFAIEIPASVEVGVGKKKAKDPERTSLLLVKKWMAALEGQEYFRTIRKWALSLAPPLRDLRVGVPGHAGNREVIVSICYPKPGPENEQTTRPEIEIHRQAFCLLKGHELFQPCACMCCPTWLDNAVAAAVLAEGQDREKQILTIAKDVEKRGGELVGSRCEDDIVELE